MWIQFGCSHLVFSTWDTCLPGYCSNPFRFDLKTYLWWFHHTFEPPSPTSCDSQTIDVWNKHLPMNHFLFLYPPATTQQNNQRHKAKSERDWKVKMLVRFVLLWGRLKKTTPSQQSGKGNTQKPTAKHPRKKIGAVRGKQRFGLRKWWGFKNSAKMFGLVRFNWRFCHLCIPKG